MILFAEADALGCLFGFFFLRQSFSFLFSCQFIYPFDFFGIHTVHLIF